MYAHACGLHLECNLSSSVLWKWMITKVLARAFYCSSQFLNASPKSFAQDVTGETCNHMTWPSSLNRWRNFRKSWSSGDQYGRKNTSGHHGQKPKSWYQDRGSICFRSLKDPCGVCLKGFSTNSVFYGCSSWIPPKCSGIPGSLILGSSVNNIQRRPDQKMAE